MNEIDALVPGFANALQQVPGTAQAYQRLNRALDSSMLTPRSRAQISLAVANQVGCDYCIWVATRLAETHGLSGEDILFAGAGTALEPREAALVRLAHRMVANGVLLKLLKCDAVDAALVGDGDVAEVAAHVALCILTFYVLQDIAPQTGRAVTQSRRAA